MAAVEERDGAPACEVCGEVHRVGLHGGLILSHEAEMRRRARLRGPRKRPFTLIHRQSQSEAAAARHARERNLQLALEAATGYTVSRTQTRAIIKALSEDSHA